MCRKLLTKMYPFGLYVLPYIMVVRISVDFTTKKIFLTEAVFILICCCALLKFISNMQYIIIYCKMILPENEFSLLKSVNNQPYLDIWTSASQLIRRFLFSRISLFFLLSCFLHSSNRPFPTILSLCQNESKCEIIHMICTSLQIHFMIIKLIFIWKVSHEDSLWNRGTRIHSSMSWSQEPLIVHVIWCSHE